MREPNLKGKLSKSEPSKKGKSSESEPSVKNRLKISESNENAKPSWGDFTKRSST